MAEQFSDHTGAGGKRLADTVGAGSENFGKDGRRADGGWEKGASGLRGAGQQSIVDCFRSKPHDRHSEQKARNDIGPTKMYGLLVKEELEKDMSSLATEVPPLAMSDYPSTLATEADLLAPSLHSSASKLLHGCIIYVNGSTYPLISDHFLRHLINMHGGNTSTVLGRRRVTHVVLTHKEPTDDRPLTSTPCASSRGSTATTALRQDGFRAAGGALANGKIAKEIQRKQLSKINFVTAHWVMESVRAGKRLPEGWFADWRFVEKGQEDVRRFFGATK